jgi:hypothetical protein
MPGQLMPGELMADMEGLELGEGGREGGSWEALT